MNQNDEQYKIFKQVLHAFYHNGYKKEEAIQKEILEKNIHIEPKIIYDSFKKSIKLEFKIGDKQFYKLKSLTEFYDRMLNHELYRYGAKLEFIHTEEAFSQEDEPLLNYILKYAEIVKYANEVAGSYGRYMKAINDEYITVSNTGLDELFEVLNGKNILLKKDYTEKEVQFSTENPEIRFQLEYNEKNDDYKITTNIDVFSYDILEGKEYIYLLIENKLYQCNKSFKDTVIKLLQIFRSNYTQEICFKKEELPSFCSLIFPNIKEQVDLSKIDSSLIEKYIPEELFVKLYLDIDENNYILADIKFVYGEKEFNPLTDQKQEMARDIAKENEVLDIFVNTGFMLDKENARLILVNEEKIYQFLSNEIETYMQKFEVLATETFKQKGIRQPKIGNLGVKVEDSLLKIDFSNMDFDIEELKAVMQQYRLKKKYHRLKDGSFLQLEDNETMRFISSITDELDVDYRQIEKGEISLPLYRGMYLDRLLKNIKEATITKTGEFKQLVNSIDKKEMNTEINVPDNLNANLRNYQKIGFQWLMALDSYQLGGILADDMGLGKTVQMLAVVLSYVNNAPKAKPSIVVCPSSLSLNWESEIKKFAPTLKCLVIRGCAEERAKQIKKINQHHIIVTSYDLLKRDIDLYKELNYEFKFIIADEAQYIKNNNTQNSKAIKSIQAETRYALTGTPIENSLSELWSIFDFIMPGYLFHYKKFKELYEIPIIRDSDENTMNRLKMLIEPFILRRIKKEVLTELPDKTITILNNEMQEEQLKIYMSYVASAKKEAIREINENGFEKSQIKILALLMRLRQICCHPSLFLENYKGESSKLNQCTEVVKDAVAAGHKILLFSGYTSMFEILEEKLKKEKIKYFKLTGQTKVGDRIKLVDEFNENEDVKVFLISLKAGGTGLNLIGADMVIHYDPWWNLSAENQATDRTYRIGQKKNVQVYKLITKNSIEEKIYELQQKKAKLADNLLSTEATFINRLSKEDIMSLFE